MPTPADALLTATAHLPTPSAILDETALWANADDLVERAAGVPIRVATKSVRVREVVERTLGRDGFAGVMSYSLRESLWLVEHGIDDVLLAYPTVDPDALRALASDDAARAAITLMVDSVEHLDVVDAALGPGHPSIRLCLDVDASLRIGPPGLAAHLGVRRSPVHTARQARTVARAIEARAGFELVGLMFYDAQIAGLPDTSPAVRLVKKASNAELHRRRRTVVDAVRQHADLTLVNAGGTGSLETTGADPVVTELTAGSGLFCPTLFDGYDAFEARAAAFFALSVTRRPSRSVATLHAGGYVASGPASDTRLPTPVWPTGLDLLGTEGAGEVQTPVTGRNARHLSVGDRVLLRYAKAGEMCERFDSIALVREDGTVEQLPTYRGEGKAFG